MFSDGVVDGSFYFYFSEGFFKLLLVFSYSFEGVLKLLFDGFIKVFVYLFYFEGFLKSFFCLVGEVSKLLVLFEGFLKAAVSFSAVSNSEVKMISFVERKK